MLNALLSQTVAGQSAEAHRHAYNAAFEELGLSWYWDAATYARLQVHGRDGVRMYLETEQSHLLRAYEAEFLVGAIETTQARCYASMNHRTTRTAYGWIGESHISSTLRPKASTGTSTQRAATALT